MKSTPTNGRETWLTMATPACVADSFGGEVVALNLDTGYYFSLTDLAGAIWRDLATGHSTGEIVAALAAVDEKIGAEADQFMAKLVELGLMRRADGDLERSAELECGKLAASGFTAVSLVSYDDMKDLVMNDPIHEVDEESGWPVRPGEPV